MCKIVVFTTNDLFAGWALQKAVESYPDYFTAFLYVDNPFSTFKKELFILKKSGLRYVFYQAFNKVLIKIVILLFSRFFKFKHPFVSQIAKRYQIRVMKVKKINSKSVEESLLNIAPDIILSVICPQIIKERILRIPKHGAINIHKSLLPKYRGLNPVFWAMLNGEREIGITAHFMEKSIDSGDIIDQRRIQISPSDSFFFLNNKCADIASEVIHDLITKIVHGREIHSFPQNKDKASYFSVPTKKDIREFKRKKLKFLSIRMFAKSQLKLIYYFLRPVIPRSCKWYFQKKWAKRIDGLSTRPMWPLPEISEDSKRINFPENQETSLVLTHDVDTKFGFENIKNVCEAEKRLGLKSSWNIIPHLYNIDESILKYLRNLGMEIGVHDWNHDGKLFSNKEIFNKRIKHINQTMKEWSTKGFRAGAAFHNDIWMQRFECEYDSSYYDTDPFQPLGGGCASIWPFMLGQLVELPYTMPQDHVLFVAEMELKVSKENSPNLDSNKRKKNWEWMRNWCEKNMLKSLDGYWIIRGVDIWKMKAEWLVDQGGMILMVTHPEYLCRLKMKSKQKTKAQNDSIFWRKGWMPDDDEDIVIVREEGIVKEKFHGSLLEQYAAFLNWFNRKHGEKTWHCLPREMSDWLKKFIP